MKSISIFILFLLSLVSCNTRQGIVSDSLTRSTPQLIDSLDMTNNFYDNTETLPLPAKELIIEGEIANPGKVDFSMTEEAGTIFHCDDYPGISFMVLYHPAYLLYDPRKKKDMWEHVKMLDRFLKENCGAEKG